MLEFLLFLHFVVYLIRLLRSTVKDATRIERKKRIDLLQHEDSLRVLQTTLDYFTIKLVEPLDVYALSLGTLFCIEQSEWMCSEPFTEWVFNRPETIAALSGFFLQTRDHCGAQRDTTNPSLNDGLSSSTFCRNFVVKKKYHYFFIMYV